MSNGSSPTVSYRAFRGQGLFATAPTLRECVAQTAALSPPDTVRLEKLISQRAYTVPREVFCQLTQPETERPLWPYPPTVYEWLPEKDIPLEWDHSNTQFQEVA